MINMATAMHEEDERDAAPANPTEDNRRINPRRTIPPRQLIMVSLCGIFVFFILTLSENLIAFFQSLANNQALLNLLNAYMQKKNNSQIENPPLMQMVLLKNQSAYDPSNHTSVGSKEESD